MALFKRKDKKEKLQKEEEIKAAPQPASSVPSLKDVKAASAAPAEKPAATSKKAASAPAPASKAPAAKAPASKTPAAKAPATKAPTAKPTTAKAPAAKSVKAPVSVPKSSSPIRPFFVATEDDIRFAFDQAIEEADREILKSASKAVGKYEFALEVDGFHFYLFANNGQILFDSPSFTTLIGALNGLKTFKKTVAEGTFDIRVDKYDRYRFILERKYYGENYTSKEQCTKCVESVKKFANNAKVIRYTPDKEAIKAFEAAKATKRTPDNIDWRAVEKAEAQAQKMGKFEICAEGDQYCFYLLANNGQILYSSRYYANEKACRNGIDSFKRAAYVGNFFVDRDKFGNYRYVLKNIGSAPAFIGESYDNKPQCEKIIDSVKKFIITATVELEVKAIV